jgi:hypothetical protein
VLGWSLFLSIVGNLLLELPAIAAPTQPPGGPLSASVAVGAVKASAPKPSQTDSAALKAVDRTALPSTAVATVPVAGAGVAVGGLPVTLDAAPSAVDGLVPGRAPKAAPAVGSVRVETRSRAQAQAAGVNGVLVTLSRADGGAAALGGGVLPFAPLYFISMGTSWVDYKILGPRHDSQGLVCTTATACYNIFEIGADLHKGQYFHAP